MERANAVTASRGATLRTTARLSAHPAQRDRWRPGVAIHIASRVTWANTLLLLAWTSVRCALSGGTPRVRASTCVRPAQRDLWHPRVDKRDAACAPRVRSMIRKGNLSAGHAVKALSIQSLADQQALANALPTSRTHPPQLHDVFECANHQNNNTTCVQRHHTYMEIDA